MRKDIRAYLKSGLFGMGVAAIGIAIGFNQPWIAQDAEPNANPIEDPVAKTKLEESEAKALREVEELVLDNYELRAGGVEGRRPPKQGYLGIAGKPVDKDAMQRLSWDSEIGVVVTEIFPDSPATHAGLLVDDIIVKINGEKVEGYSHLATLMKETKPGDRCELTIWRDGNNSTLSVPLGKWPGKEVVTLEDQNTEKENFSGPKLRELEERNSELTEAQSLLEESQKRVKELAESIQSAAKSGNLDKLSDLTAKLAESSESVGQVRERIKQLEDTLEKVKEAAELESGAFSRLSEEAATLREKLEGALGENPDMQNLFEQLKTKEWESQLNEVLRKMDVLREEGLGKVDQLFQPEFFKDLELEGDWDEILEIPNGKIFKRFRILRDGEELEDAGEAESVFRDFQERMDKMRKEAESNLRRLIEPDKNLGELDEGPFSKRGSESMERESTERMNKRFDEMEERLKRIEKLLEEKLGD